MSHPQKYATECYYTLRHLCISKNTFWVIWSAVHRSQIIRSSNVFWFLWSSFRFHEHWRFVLQRLTFLAAFVVYLETETLVTREEVAQILSSRCHLTQSGGAVHQERCVLFCLLCCVSLQLRWCERRAFTWMWRTTWQACWSWPVNWWGISITGSLQTHQPLSNALCAGPPTNYACNASNERIILLSLSVGKFHGMMSQIHLVAASAEHGENN